MELIKPPTDMMEFLYEKVSRDLGSNLMTIKEKHKDLKKKVNIAEEKRNIKTTLETINLDPKKIKFLINIKNEKAFNDLGSVLLNF